MQNYITWIWKPVEWGIEHPNTHDQDKTVSWDEVNFTETPYFFSDGRNLAYITYNENITSYQDLVDFAAVEPAFELTIIDEIEANLLLSELWDVSVTDFVFEDNRPVDFLI